MSKELSPQNKVIIAHMTSFIKESMCIIGTVSFDSFSTVKTSEGDKSGIVFKCVDQKRGTFFIAWSTEVQQTIPKEKLKTFLEELQTDRILVDAGTIFEGTREQFRDCFFDNASNEQILDWCEKEGYSLKINDVTIL